MYNKGDWEVKELPVTKELAIYSGTELIAGGLTEANASLLVQAPKLYEACKAQHEAIDILFARLIELDKEFFPSESGRPWEAMKQGNQAIASVV